MQCGSSGDRDASKSSQKGKVYLVDKDLLMRAVSKPHKTIVTGAPMEEDRRALLRNAFMEMLKEEFGQTLSRSKASLRIEASSSAISRPSEFLLIPKLIPARSAIPTKNRFDGTLWFRLIDSTIQRHPLCKPWFLDLWVE